LHLSIRLFHRDLIQATRHIFSPSPIRSQKHPTLNNSVQGKAEIVKMWITDMMS
jgi:hypothetical protein